MEADHMPDERVRFRIRIAPTIVALGPDAVAAWYRGWLTAWSASGEPHAAEGDTWAALLSGRWFVFPPLGKENAGLLERFLRQVGGVDLERMNGELRTLGQ